MAFAFVNSIWARVGQPSGQITVEIFQELMVKVTDHLLTRFGNLDLPAGQAGKGLDRAAAEGIARVCTVRFFASIHQRHCAGNLASPEDFFGALEDACLRKLTGKTIQSYFYENTPDDLEVLESVFGQGVTLTLFQSCLNKFIGLNSVHFLIVVSYIERYTHFGIPPSPREIADSLRRPHLLTSDIEAALLGFATLLASMRHV